VDHDALWEKAPAVPTAMPSRQGEKSARYANMNARSIQHSHDQLLSRTQNANTKLRKEKPRSWQCLRILVKMKKKEKFFF
jgi:hypothetical protein